jgi:hypothetical protein
LGGRQFDSVTQIPVCANCHAKVTDMQKDHPRKIHNPSTSDEDFAHFLFGLADFLELVIEKLREFANYLLERVRCAGAGSVPNADVVASSWVAE